jgi:hypothetical protein
MPSGIVITKRDAGLMGGDQRYRLTAKKPMHPTMSGS